MRPLQRHRERQAECPGSPDIRAARAPPGGTLFLPLPPRSEVIPLEQDQLC